MLAGVILGVLPLRPDFEELLHRQQLPALKHLVDVLLPLGVGLGACQRARVALKPLGEFRADRGEEAFDRFVPRLIRQRASDLLDANALVLALLAVVELDHEEAVDLLDLSHAAVIPFCPAIFRPGGAVPGDALPGVSA